MKFFEPIFFLTRFDDWRFWSANTAQWFILFSWVVDFVKQKSLLFGLMGGGDLLDNFRNFNQKLNSTKSMMVNKFDSLISSLVRFQWILKRNKEKKKFEKLSNNRFGLFFWQVSSIEKSWSKHNDIDDCDDGDDKLSSSILV